MKCKTHNGTAQLIREELKRSAEPMSVYRLFLATGKTTKQVKHAIGQMVVSGGVVSGPGPKGIVYSLYKPVERVPRQPQQGNRAAPITIGRGARWYSGLV